MKTGKLCAMALAAALVLAGSGEAKAQWGGWGCGGGYGGGFGFGIGTQQYRIGNIPIPPYFSLHPPVYYGQIVHRSYGLSPFAYPGYTSPGLAPRPTVLVNPYMRQRQPQQQHADEEEAAGLETAANWAPKPLLVMNPYVESNGSAVTQSRPEPIINPYVQTTDSALAQNN